MLWLCFSSRCYDVGNTVAIRTPEFEAPQSSLVCDLAWPLSLSRRARQADCFRFTPLSSPIRPHRPRSPAPRRHPVTDRHDVIENYSWAASTAMGFGRYIDHVAGHSLNELCLSIIPALNDELTGGLVPALSTDRVPNL